jgi:hypothetical protein
MTHQRDRQRGSAMLVTMIVIAALLAGAAVLAAMQLSANKSTELTRNGLAALYCAEAALAAGRTVVTTNYGNWDAAMQGNCSDDTDCTTLVEPSWLADPNVLHDIDGDTVADFALYIRDNDDDTGTQNYADDSDEMVYIVARCTKYPDSPRQVEELIHYKPAMNPYNCQLGGANSGGNDNDNNDTCDGL